MSSFVETGRIKVFLKDPNKKNIFRIIKEVLVLMYVKRQIPYYYFKYIYRKRITNYKDYLSSKQVVKIGLSQYLHRPEYHFILNNKLVFCQFIERLPLKSPKLISYNLDKSFVFKGSITKVNSVEDLINFYTKIFEESKHEALFVRPATGYGGKGCFKLTKHNLTIKLQDNFEAMVNSCYLQTEVVKQHEVINKIHSKSLNTLRLVSLITPNDQIEIIGAFIRFGVGDNEVDNASSGGFFVGINIEEGTLKELGHYLPEHGGKEISAHPDSGFIFNGFEVPYFKEACEEVKKALEFIPDRLIGWDVGITPDGPTIIEANYGPHLPMTDIAYGGLLQNKHVKELLDNLE